MADLKKNQVRRTVGGASVSVWANESCEGKPAFVVQYPCRIKILETKGPNPKVEAVTGEHRGEEGWAKRYIVETNSTPIYPK